jgi:hypothetical protein
MKRSAIEDCSCSSRTISALSKRIPELHSLALSLHSMVDEPSIDEPQAGRDLVSVERTRNLGRWHREFVVPQQWTLKILSEMKSPRFPGAPAHPGRRRNGTEQPSDMALRYPHLVRQPCPDCQSHRTIQMAEDSLREKLYCPDCGRTWSLPTSPSILDIGGVSPLHGAAAYRARIGSLFWRKLPR